MALKLSKKQKEEGWTVVRFDQVAREAKGTTKDPEADGLEFYVGLEHLDPQSLRIVRKGLIAEDKPTFTKTFAPGHILFGKRRSYQKKAAVADFAGICSGDIIVMEAIPKSPMIAGLLPFIVQSDGFFDYAEKTSMGSLSPRTKWASLAEYEFPLPPPERQRQILKVLQKVETSYDKAIETLESVNELTKSLIERHCKSLNNANSTLFEIGKVGKWRGGGTPSMSNKEYWTNGDIPWISSKDMTSDVITTTEDKITSLAIKESSTNLIDENSIVFVTRSGILRHTLPVGYTKRKMAINQDIKALTCYEFANSKYVWIILLHYSSTILKSCIKTGTTVESLDTERLKSFKMHLPNMSEQMSLVGAWEALRDVSVQLSKKSERLRHIRQRSL